MTTKSVKNITTLQPTKLKKPRAEVYKSKLKKYIYIYIPNYVKICM